MSLFRLLEWDTDFFGFPVASIVPVRLTEVELDHTLASMRKAGVRLAYWASDPGDGESQRAALSCGGFLADRKVTYIVDVGKFPRPVDRAGLAIGKYTDPIPTAEMEELALQAGSHSRFKVDPRMPAGKFADLYRLWIRNSVRGKIAAAVIVARREGRIVGMVTVGEKNGRGDIGLIAVDAGMRGMNVGASLVAAAVDWARARGFERAQVVSQGENDAACRFYERCGYSVDKVEILYHFWI